MHASLVKSSFFKCFASTSYNESNSEWMKAPDTEPTSHTCREASLSGRSDPTTQSPAEIGGETPAPSSGRRGWIRAIATGCTSLRVGSCAPMMLAREGSPRIAPGSLQSGTPGPEGVAVAHCSLKRRREQNLNIMAQV